MSIPSLTSLEVNPDTHEAWEKHLGGTTDPETLRLELTHGNLVESVDQAAAANRDKPALIIEGGAMSHGELRLLSARAAGWLTQNGVRRGTNVLLCAKNSLDLVVAYLGVLRAGGVVISVSHRVTLRELAILLARSKPVVALADHQQLQLLHSLEIDQRPKTIAPLSIPSATNGEALGDASIASDDVASVFFTSGTTGTPKAAPLTHANQLATIRSAMMAWRWDRDDVLVHALPLSHGHGLGGLHAVLLSGSTAIIFDRFDPKKLCDAIREYEASVVFAVPTIYQRLVDWDGFRARRLPSLRLAVSGSAPLSPRLAQRVADVIGQLPLERYGTTEGGLAVSNPYQGKRKPGSVGLPLPGMEVAIVDDTGVPVAPGESGEIVLRGPQVFRGYLESDVEPFLPGGWFKTGDIARIDPHDNYVAIVARQKEMIITGGLNVYPREVELILEEYRNVAVAAVVGIPSETWGEEVIAFVTPPRDKDIDIDDLREFLRHRLAPYKIPKRIIEVESLPVNSLGKVVKQDLVELAESTSVHPDPVRPTREGST